MSATAVIAPPSKAAALPGGFLGTTVGRKVVMAATGVVLFGFVLAHMLGNLQVYMGPEPYNAYSEFLHRMLHGAGLWLARGVLLVSVGLHIWAAAMLTLESWAARPTGYRRWEPRESTYASRTMRWGGVIILVFVIYHLLHFTFGTVHPDFVPGDVYHNFVAGFRVVPVAIFYGIANALLGLHLYHGVWSMLRTLGVSHPRYILLAKRAALLFALLITAGNLSFPIAVLSGVVR